MGPLLTLYIQGSGHLQDGCQGLVDHLAPDLLPVVCPGHGECEAGHREPGAEVQLLGPPVSLLPPLAPDVPLEAGRGVAPGRRALDLHFTAGSGHKRSAKW